MCVCPRKRKKTDEDVRIRVECFLRENPFLGKGPYIKLCLQKNVYGMSLKATQSMLLILQSTLPASYREEGEARREFGLLWFARVAFL